MAELGVAEAAGDEQVRAAYKKLAREWHPDKNHAVEATERFQRINAAYHRLTQEDDAGYDELAEQDIFDFFEAMFQEISRKGGMGGGGSGGPFGLGGVIFIFGSARGDDSDEEDGAFYERCSQPCPLPHPIFPVPLTVTRSTPNPVKQTDSGCANCQVLAPRAGAQRGHGA